MKTELGLLLSMLLGASCTVNYDGYKVLRFLPEDEHQVRRLHAISDEVDFWKPATVPGQAADAMIGPHQRDLPVALEIPHRVYIQNVGELIERSHTEPGVMGAMLPFNTSRFYTRDELHTFLDEAAALCGADCNVVNIGSSYEGGDIKVIRISRPGTDRPSIWIDGGVHAREWLAPAVASYFIDKLINDYGTDPDVTTLRDSFDWYIHNLVNPDGYDYTWTTDRMWRKTRKPNAGSSCVGTDGNRNYDYVWDQGSTLPCDETYRGESPESESEISTLTAYVQTFAPSAALSVSLHTYGQVLLRPWGHMAQDPVDYVDLESLGAIGVSATNANSNVVYTQGKTSGTGSGMSMDWAKGAAGIKYAYTFEMRDEGGYGFVAPPEEILPTCVEIFAGVSAMALDLAAQP